VAGGAIVVVRSAETPEADTSGTVRHEWAAAATLMMLPLLAYALAAAWTGAVVSRYSLPWTIGFGIVLPWTIASSARHRHILLLSLAATLFLWVGARQGVSARWLAHRSPDIALTFPLLAEQGDGATPIVIPHPHVYLMALHYAPPELASRLVVLAAPTSAQERPGTAIRGFRALEKWKPLRLEDFDRFLAEHQEFLVYGPTVDGALTWLHSAGAVMVLRGLEEDGLRFPMSRPGPYSLYDVAIGGSIQKAGDQLRH
jgi:hypothetical protein